MNTPDTAETHTVINILVAPKLAARSHARCRGDTSKRSSGSKLRFVSQNIWTNSSLGPKKPQEFPQEVGQTSQCGSTAICCPSVLKRPIEGAEQRSSAASFRLEDGSGHIEDLRNTWFLELNLVSSPEFSSPELEPGLVQMQPGIAGVVFIV